MANKLLLVKDKIELKATRSDMTRKLVFVRNRSEGMARSYLYKHGDKTTADDVSIIAPNDHLGRYFAFIMSLAFLCVQALSATISQGSPFRLDIYTNVADMVANASPLNLNKTVLVEGVNTPGDGGGGTFHYVSGSSAATNTGTVFPTMTGTGRWMRQYSGAVELAWFGPKLDGSGDNAPIIAAADAAVSGKGTLILPSGMLRIANSIYPGRGHKWVAQGNTADGSTNQYGGTVIIKDGNFDGIVVTNAEVCLESFQIKGDVGDGHDGIVVAGGECVMFRVTSSTHGAVGLRVGGKSAGFNANTGRYYALEILSNASHGVYVHDGGGGLPNANVGIFSGFDVRGNGGDGFRFQNAIDNKIIGGDIEQNGGDGIRHLSGSKGNRSISVYTESNAGGHDWLFDNGAYANTVDGVRQGTDLVITDNSVNGLKNDVNGRMYSKVENDVWRNKYFQQIRVIAPSFSGEMSLTQSGHNTYYFTDSTGVSPTFQFGSVSVPATVSSTDLAITRQGNFNGTYSAFDSYLRFNDGPGKTNRLEIARYANDNEWLAFDAHYNGTSFISDDPNSNFMLRKSGATFQGAASANNAVGASITWTNAFTYDRTGTWTFNKAIIHASQSANTLSFFDSTKALRTIPGSIVPDDGSSITVTALSVSGGDVQTQLNGKQASDSDLTALANNSSNGLWARTGTGTGAARTITGSADVPVTNGDGVSGNPTLGSIASKAVTYAKIQDISATQRVLGRNTAGAGSTEEVTATQLLDWIGSTRGSVLYRGASGWSVLAPGTSGYVLTSNGAGADPSYQAASGGGSGYTTIQEEGSGLTARTTLNFIGGGVTAADNSGATKTDVTITRTGVKREIWIPASEMVVGYNGGSTPTYTTVSLLDVSEPVPVWSFPASTTAHTTFTVSLPESWNASSLKAKFYWTGTAGSAGETLTWAIGARNSVDGDLIDATVSASGSSAADTYQGAKILHVTPATGFFNGLGTQAVGNMLTFDIGVNPNGRTAASLLLGVKIQYTESTTEPAAW